MSGFLRSVARMAIGQGPRLEPLVDSIYAGTFELGTQEEESLASQMAKQTEVRNTTYNSHVQNSTNVEGDTHDHLTLIDQTTSVDNSAVHHSSQTDIREGDQVTIRAQAQKETNTIRETVRELLKQSETLRSERITDRVERLERHTKTESTNLTAFLETERIVREIQKPGQTKTIRDRALILNRDETPVEPIIEITIGRIEVKSTPGESTKEKTKEGKPTGVIALNDYLRERSKGAI